MDKSVLKTAIKKDVVKITNETFSSKAEGENVLLNYFAELIENAYKLGMMHQDISTMIEYNEHNEPSFKQL